MAFDTIKNYKILTLIIVLMSFCFLSCFGGATQEQVRHDWFLIERLMYLYNEI